ncbi:aminotransferase class V-fold PLP-dependent enzyme [Croceicoccus ponticola]|uniref:Cysteine desulfurase n=1 Tax=Croceicoccus ponticola TaxID=2217664 RepID=A0A437GUK3_9SPHN|nr:aminotransferase class V-fold PLP-dependent enzyme [Croceicoccus ponticola]RVQ64745.1 aminotransferase class V-fold PLP-dependent enzyme [Croceicoccus ponticola]
MSQTYLDHAASAPVLAEARAAMLDGLALDANASSPHAGGRAARRALETARERVAAALGWTGEVIFTSGASEALAIALSRSHAARRIVSAVEHEAVMRHVPGARVVPVDTGGLVDPAALGDTTDALVAVQQVNNETGVMQPLGAVADAVRSCGGVLLADCAQAAGKIALPDCDMAAISGHKFGAPPGIGALLVRDFALLAPTGGQERGYRGGTENVPGAMAMAAALETGNDWMAEALRLRARLEDAIIDAGGEVMAPASPRIATIGSYRIPGLASAVQLIRLDGAGIAVSAGSACSSGSLRPSRVLTAMGMTEKASSEVIRVSIGPDTRDADVDRFLEVWSGLAAQVGAGAGA